MVWICAASLPKRFSEATKTHAVPLVLSPTRCVYRSRAMRTLEEEGVTWSGVFILPSFSSQAAAVRAQASAMP